MTVVWAILFLVAALVYVVAFQQDLRHRRIPNILSAILLALGAIKWLLHGELHKFGWAVAAAALVFLFTCFMFWRGWMGGGDVKLMTSTSFLLGGSNTIDFVFRTAVIGGLVAGMVWIYSTFRRRDPTELPNVGDGAAAAPAAKVTVPYGTAIALAALWVLYEQWISR